MKRYIDVGNRIKKLREPLTQVEFAKKIGVSLTALQNYESGLRVPKGDVLYRITTICESSPDLILYGKPHEPTIEEAREAVRHALHIEGIEYTEEDVERNIPIWMQAHRIAEPGREYKKPDPLVDKINRLLVDMSEEEKKAVLKYAETQKHLIEELKKSQEIESDFVQHLREKRPRPVPIDFSSLERYALRLYEFAEQQGMAHKLDEIMERLLNDLKTQSDQPKKEPLERRE